MGEVIELLVSGLCWMPMFNVQQDEDWEQYENMLERWHDRDYRACWRERRRFED